MKQFQKFLACAVLAVGLLFGTSDRAVNAQGQAPSTTPIALTDGTTISVPVSGKQPIYTFTVTLGGSRTLANPTGFVIGQQLNFVISQNSTGGFGLSYGTDFNWVTNNGLSPNLNLAPNANTIISCIANTTSTLQCGGGISSPVFRAANGQIITPSGNLWNGYGVDVTLTDISWGVSVTTLKGQFPGIGIIRLLGNAALTDTALAYAPFINDATKQGIVVVIGDFNLAGTVLTSGTTPTLAAESAWYASMATYYLNNPYVWFQSMNEPNTGDSAQMAATYAAIRSTGNNAPIIMEAGQGADGSATSTLGSTTPFGSMHNVGWDLHCYNWMPGYSASSPVILTDQNTRISTYQALQSADGLMPVITMETGPSSSGTTSDAGGSEEVQVTFGNGNLIGVVAHGYDSFADLNALTTSSGSVGTLTTWGTTAAGYIAVAPP